MRLIVIISVVYNLGQHRHAKASLKVIHKMDIIYLLVQSFM